MLTHNKINAGAATMPQNDYQKWFICIQGRRTINTDKMLLNTSVVLKST